MVRVTPIACLADNYAYLLEDGSGELAVVDASEAGPVEVALARTPGRLSALFTTHHHHDHVGGNAELAAAHAGLRVFGYQSDRGRIPAQTEFLQDGQTFSWGATTVRALHVPGHTLGAIAYLLGDVVFTGDTLFLAGCGRLFEGTPAMMDRSLNQVLAPLAPSTRVYCGHEYTLANLAFAASVDPDNAEVKDRLIRTHALREHGQPSVGTSMELELATNPFLRCASAAMRRHFQLRPEASNLEVFTKLRLAKDSFRAPGAAT